MEMQPKPDSVILPMFAHPDAKHRLVLAKIHDLMLNASRHAPLPRLPQPTSAMRMFSVPAA